MTRAADPQRHSPFVELLGDDISRPTLGSPVDDPTGQVGKAREMLGLVQAAGQERGVDRHGRRGCRLLDDDDGAVVERVTERSQAATECRHHRSLLGGG